MILKEKFLPAFHGIADGFKDKSVCIQFILAGLAVIAGFIMHLNAVEWTVVVICIASVITAEMLNTCIEYLCNLYTTEINEKIRVIKDLAAGAVLVSSFGALVCALIILIHHI